MTPELIIVMPVFNEQASIRKVVIEWFQEIENWTKNFVFFVVNDGSTDRTVEILHQLKAQFGERLELHNQPNMGHGQSCLVGYREACNRGIPYVFQIDSDGQSDPQYFFHFWRLRNDYDVIYGHRKVREDGWRRALASQVLRVTLLVFAGVLCTDANTPYRLMRSRSLNNLLSQIPPDFVLANIALAVLLRKESDTWRHKNIPIHFRERYGGEPSVPFSSFSSRAFELTQQIQSLLKSYKPSP